VVVLGQAVGNQNLGIRIMSAAAIFELNPIGVGRRSIGRHQLVTKTRAILGDIWRFWNNRESNGAKGFWVEYVEIDTVGVPFQ
jgi:hypothetical protein